MVDEPGAVSEQSQTAPAKGRHRRSRRGGRRHSRRRAPRPGGPHPGETAVDSPEAPPTTEAGEQPAYEPSSTPRKPGVTGAIEQVTEVIEELKRVLDEMEEVLETLELAERQ